MSSPEDSTLFSDDEDGDNSPLEEYDLGVQKPELRISDPETYFKNLSESREDIERYSCCWIHSGQFIVSLEDTFSQLCDQEVAESMISIMESDIWDSTVQRWEQAKLIGENHSRRKIQWGLSKS
jgi:hypothetical protein